MKPIISRLCCLLSLTAMMASCNLFIDDDLEDEQVLSDFTNVRKHSGEGYDHVVTKEEGGCDVEYQYNDNVIVVEKETQDQYITHVETDGVNVMLEVHFRADTPQELLPQPGEIFLSTVTDKFPMGANHLVEKRQFEDGVYKCLMSFATLKDTFKELHINGRMAFETDTIAVPIPPLPDDESAEARMTRDGVGINEVIASFSSDGFGLKIPMSWSFKGALPNGVHFEAGMNKEDNYYEIKNEFNFDNFSLDNLKADLIQTIDEKSAIFISGGFTKTIPLLALKPVKGKALTIGPVVLVLFVNLNVDLNFDITGSVTITKHKKYQNIYHLDFYEKTVKKEVKILKDQDWEFSASISGTMSIDVALTIGIGLYGKVLSVRIIPTITPAITLTVPIASPTSEGTKWFDVSNGGGLKFTLQFSLKVGIFLDLSLEALLGSDDMQKKMRNTKDMLDKLKTSEVMNNQVYQDLMNSEADKLDETNELGAYVTFGPWNIIEPKEFTWYPQVDDKSFKINRSWDKETQKMSFSAEYKLRRLGFWVGLGKQFTPALMIKKGKQYITSIFPTEGGMDAKCSKDKTYTFEIPVDINEKDIMYTAYPCFFPRPVIYNTPEAFDKGLPFCNTSPNITITDVQPYSLEVEWLAENGIGEFIEDDFYEWAYTFGVKTYTAVKGIANIDKWHVNEVYTHERHTFDKKNDDKRDGIYIMYWDFTVYRQNNHRFMKSLQFYPWFKVVGADKYEDGPGFSLRLWSDRTYEIVNDGTGYGLYGLSFSRMRGEGLDDDDGKEVVRGQLNAVERDGEIIWQRPGYQHNASTSAIPFKRL